MSGLPKVTQKNVSLFIPRKAAYVAYKLKQEQNLTDTQAILAFYNSKTYAQLEMESTKRWQESSKQLWADFKAEMAAD